MHHGTCVTHVPWCMSGSLTCGGGENVPGIPGACAPAILLIWQEAHCWGYYPGTQPGTQIGLKRYAQPTIRYDTRYDAHDTIRSAIHLPFLPGKQRLVIPAGDQKHCTPSTTTAWAVMMRSGYNNGGLLGVSRCSVFVMKSLILLEYADCYLWYLVFIFTFGMCYICYICTLSYHIILRAYRDTYRGFCIGNIPVCRCIVSALHPEMKSSGLRSSNELQLDLTEW